MMKQASWISAFAGITVQTVHEPDKYFWEQLQECNSQRASILLLLTGQFRPRAGTDTILTAVFL